MKKVIVLIVLICFCCSSLFANDFWGFGSKGASFFMDSVFLAIGTAFVLWPYLDPKETEIYNYVLYGVGGSFAVIGLIGLIYDTVSDDSDYYAKAVKENPILRIVSFGTNGKKTYIGAKFSF
jgi:hypothetical protein